MGTTIKRTTSSESTIQMVASIDTAIDWANSYPEMVPGKVPVEGGGMRDETADEVIERKKVAYREKFAIDSVALLEGETPTFQVFKNPARQDVMRHLVDLLSRVNNRSGGGSAMLFDVIAFSLVGTKEGLTGELLPCPRDETTGLITNDYVQALFDSKVFGELNAFYQEAFNHARTKQPREKK